MAYESRRPRARDLLQNSQLDFLNNYQAIDAFIAADHFPFNDAGGRDGKHKFMRFQRIAGFPALPILNNRNFSMRYSRFADSVPYRPTLFLKRQNEANQYPYTFQMNDEGVFGLTGNNGFYSLGNNIYALFWRQNIAGGIGDDDYVLEIDFPRLTNQPPFANSWTVMISNQNTGRVLNDANTAIQVIDLQINRIIVRVTKRANAGFFSPSGVAYFTVIGSI